METASLSGVSAGASGIWAHAPDLNLSLSSLSFSFVRGDSGPSIVLVLVLVLVLDPMDDGLENENDYENEYDREEP